MNAFLVMCAVIGQAQVPLIDIGRDVFAVKDKAYMVMPAQPVAPDVKEMQWSHDGKTLLFRTMDSEPEIEAALNQFEGKEFTLRIPETRVGFYSPQTAKTRWLTGLQENSMVQSLQWTSATSAIVHAVNIDLSQGQNGIPNEHLYFVTTNSSRLTPLNAINLKPGERIEVITDPATGVTLLLVRQYITDPATASSGGPKLEGLFELTPSGQVLAPPSAVKEALAQGWNPAWGLPGKGIVFYGRFGCNTQYRLLTPKMVFEPWIPPQDYNVFAPTTPVVLNHVRGQIGDMLIITPNERKPEGTDTPNPVIVCQQVEISELSPSLSAVAYTSQRMLWIRHLQPISLEDYLRALELKRRMEAMSNAKQVGTALMIYAADNDDKLPDGDPFAALGPYLKNDSLLKNFVFTFPSGKSLADIADPAATEVGHIPLPGGRIVTYADSHVKWVPDTK